MKLVDILPIEKWVEIEKEINRQSGLNAAVYDVAGVRITDSLRTCRKISQRFQTTGWNPLSATLRKKWLKLF